MTPLDLAILATVGMLLCLGWLLRIWWAIRPWKDEAPQVDDARIHAIVRQPATFSGPAKKGARPGYTRDDATVERLDAWRKSR